MNGETAGVVERLVHAMNEHDLDGLLGCFDPEYRSEQPAHPNRGFGGREQVRANWSAMFEGIPDFRADVLGTAVAGASVWSEWRWTGTRSDGTALDVRGVTLFEIRDERIVSARLYMEEVEQAGEDIEGAVRRLAGEGPHT